MSYRPLDLFLRSNRRNRCGICCSRPKPFPKLLQKGLRIQLHALHRNRCREAKYCVIQLCPVLPFRKKTLPVKLSKLRMPQPYRRQISVAAASMRRGFQADDTIFPAIPFGPLHAQVVETLQIVLIHGWNRPAFFGCLDETSEGVQSVNGRVIHLRHR